MAEINEKFSESLEEIKVTPEMIEAGLCVLHESGEVEYETSSQ